MRSLNCRGFGIVSLLIAIAVLVVGVTAFIRAYYGSFFAISSFSDRFIMINVGREVMERVMKTGVIPSSYSVTYNGVTYNVHVSTVTPVWIDTQQCHVSSNMESIEVVVERSDRPTRRIELYTLREK